MNKELEEAIKKLDYYKTILIVVDETGTPNDLAQAIEIVLKALDNSISKEVIEKKIEELDKLIIETQKELGSASKEYTIYVYQKQVLQELLEGK